MARVIKLHGPPGTGKTTWLTARAVKAAAMYGPDRVGAVTFTRAGADELKTRIASALGLELPSDEYRRRRVLDARMPWIGTIHSISLKLMGGHGGVLSSKQLADFLGGAAPSMDDMEGYVWAEPGKNEREAALAAYAGARHRMASIEEAWPDIPWGYQGPSIGVEQAEQISREYEDFKRQLHRIDFEDMLEIGRRYSLPVDVLLADEVQDNSMLLWSVIDRWSEGIDYVMAGDPYQAIYIFSGARPELFINHEGEKISLGNSHRLSEEAAAFAQGIILRGGYIDEGWLGTWTGVGNGEGRDNATEFWLARTKNLLYGVQRELESEGQPYGWVRGGGPLSTKAAQAFRTFARLNLQGAADAYSVHRMVEEIPASHMPQGERARLKSIAAQQPDLMLFQSELAERWGERAFESAEALDMPNADYFERVLAGHGVSAFSLPPRTLVGTIHSAKGKEADHVHLITSWATLPYRAALGSEAGAKAEACVAYVASTRHRARLHMEYGYGINPYPAFD